MGNNRALCTLLSRLTPYASTCFPFLFGVSAKCVTQEGEQGVWGAGVCAEMDCQALFTLAGTSCGYQPVANCQPAITPSSFPPRVTLPPCSLSRAKVGLALQDFLDQTADTLAKWTARHENATLKVYLP